MVGDIAANGGQAISAAFEIYVAAALAAIGCSLAGTFLVLRRESMLAEVLSHAILPGLVLGYWLAAGPSLALGSLGALVAAIAAMGVILLLSTRFRVTRDASMAFTFSAFFALGVLSITAFYADVHLDLDAVLFGELLFSPFERVAFGVHDLGPRAWWIFGSLAIVQCLFIALFYRALKVVSFDTVYATLIGFSPTILGSLYLVMLSTAAVAAFSAVGSILAIALIVAPIAAARLLTPRIPKMIALTLLFAVIAAGAGTALGFALDVSLSGMIAVVLAVEFVLVAVFSPYKGLLSHVLRNRRIQRSVAEWSLLRHLNEHQGTESEECTLSHVQEVFGWSREKLLRTLNEGQGAGLLQVAGDQIEITDLGRQRALRPV